MFYFNNTTLVVKARKPKDEQLCNAVQIYIYYISDAKTLRHINKKTNTVDTTALHYSSSVPVVINH